MRRLWILGSIACCVAACGSSEGRSIDFGAGAQAPARTRDRPYPCPNVEPMAGTPCGTNELSCGYDDATCTCLADASGQFGTLIWSCDDGATANGCPAAQPQPAAACSTLFGAPECEYGSALACHCASEAQVWACWNPRDCARRQPAPGTECELVGMTCAYAAVSCECLADGWRCE